MSKDHRASKRIPRKPTAKVVTPTTPAPSSPPRDADIIKQVHDLEAYSRSLPWRPGPYPNAKAASFFDLAWTMASDANEVVRRTWADTVARYQMGDRILALMDSLLAARERLSVPDSPRVQRVVDAVRDLLGAMPSMRRHGDATWDRQFQSAVDAIEDARRVGPAQSAPPTAMGGKTVFTPTAQDLDILSTLSRRVGRVHGSKLSVLGVGQKVLSERLKRLEDEGMVDRAEGEKRGYAITPKGRALVENNAPNKRQQSAP